MEAVEYFVPIEGFPKDEDEPMDDVEKREDEEDGRAAREVEPNVVPYEGRAVRWPRVKGSGTLTRLGMLMLGCFIAFRLFR